MRTLIAGIDVDRRLWRDLPSLRPEEAKNVALDIKTKLGELALQHQASAQHQHPKPKPDTCRCVFFGPFFLG